MQVQIAIGENHRFELREALLVYHGNQTTFITKHEVITQQNTAPALGPAQPLTLAFVESLVRSLGGGAAAEVFPENILARSDRMIAWWTPAQRRQMFYQHSEGKADQLNGRIFPQPPLVWRAADGQLKIRALTENKRPQVQTKLAVAPYWNLSDCGTVCTGSMRCPGNASVAAISDWERAFYESAFTHANGGRLTHHKGGFVGLWSELTGKRALFPLKTLIVLPQTLAQFVRDERS
ncbi:PRTRC system protein B [Alloacidobacterium sp.]|uniref:PRTRC system protein B n=1 Tax=Alloacidobacterium sp. TaxID=2951999 RepID=UPI002D316CB1|nr:PRTRC system protein B [Alloacidobacterium sp.]HYK37796.1 PRTRC system protein B [Alloacidobacterium sp.]